MNIQSEECAAFGIYKNGVQHLEDELRAFSARCRRQAYQKENKHHDSEETKARLGWLQRHEQATRKEVDDRVAMTLSAGKCLPLVVLQRELELSPLESTILLMAIAPAFGLDLQDIMAGLIRSFAWSSTNLSAIADVCDLDLEGRFGLLETLGPKGKLIESGVLMIDEYDTHDVAAVWEASVSLTSKGFEILVSGAKPAA